MLRPFLLLLLATYMLPSGRVQAQVFNAALNMVPGLNVSAPDGFGNFYVGGIFAGTQTIGGNTVVSAGDNDAWIGKYDGNGNYLWHAHGGGTLFDKVVAMKVDNAGNVYGVINFAGTTTWGGTAYATAGAYDLLVVKYDPSGNLLWAKQVGSTGNENGNYVWLDLDNNQQLHLCTYIQAGSMTVGGTNYPAGGNGYHLVHIRFSAAGAVVQFHAYGHSTGASIFVPTAMHVDGAGNIYSAAYSNAPGTVGGTAIPSGVTFAKLSPAAGHVWNKQFPMYGPGKAGLITDAGGNIYLSGDWDTFLDLGNVSFTQPGVISDDIFLVSYDSNGVYRWVKNWGSTGTDNAPFCMRNAAGRIVLAGICGGPMNVDGLSLSPAGGDFYLIKLDTSGTVLSAVSSHAPATEVIFSAAMDAADNITISGGIVPPTHFGPFVFNDPMVQYFAVLMTDNACQAIGKVYRDKDNNGSFSAGDGGMNDVIVQTTPGGYYAVSGSSGNYQLFTLPGTYSISVPNVPLYHTLTTPPTQSAVFTALGQLDSANHFGLYPTPGIRDLRLQVTNLIGARPGHIAAYMISYKNVGTDTASGSVAISYPTLSYTTANPLPDITGANAQQWNFTNLLPGETRTIGLYVNVPSSATLGQVYFLHTMVSSSGNEATPNDNMVDFPATVISSYDPNDKQVTPSSVVPSYVTAGNYFTYTIRFQNTGNDTAFQVLIRDTLDANLDMGSFELLGASHPMQFRIRNGRVLEFDFQNINLPDSNVNERLSHGALSFRIKARASMATPGMINNRAGIYFDYNVPVQTNTAVVVVAPLGVSHTPSAPVMVSMYPNPACSTVWVQISGTNPGAHLELSATDLSGRVAATWPAVAGTTFSVPVQELAAGMYLMRVHQEGRIVHTGKLVISR